MSETTETPARPPVTARIEATSGAWKVHMDNGTKAGTITGKQPGATDQRCALLAAIQLLQFFKSPRVLTVQSANQVLINGMNEWLPGWKARGWRNSAGKEVANRDLWEHLVGLARGHQLEWEWTKGSPGTQGRTRALAPLTEPPPPPAPIPASTELPPWE